MKKKDIEDIAALTPMQEGMLFHYLKDPESDHYFEQLSLEISGEINEDIFERAWNFIIETNEMLRTVFRWERVENPVQIVLKQHTLHPAYYNLSSGTINEKNKQLEKIKVEDRKNKFDLRKVPFRVTLCKVDEEKYEIVISNHHILYDGWSNGIILKEFFNAYKRISLGKVLVKPAKAKFKDYIKWIETRDRTTQERFWREYLDGFDMPAALPGRRIRDKARGIESNSILLEEDIKVKLGIFSSNNRVTLASVLYSAWGILLQKYCSSDDVIFGTTVSGRSARIKGIDDTAGLFVNTIPLRVQVYPSEKINRLVFRIDRILQEREEFENTPLVDIGSYSTVEGGESLFSTIVAIENYPLDSGLLMGNSLLLVNSYSIFERTHYDFTVGIIPFDEMEVTFTYNRELYDKETVENLARHFLGILQKVVENPGEEVSQLEIATKEEKEWILYDFNNTAMQYPDDKTIHQFFAEQAARTPGKIALVGSWQLTVGKGVAIHTSKEERTDETVQLTYGELNKRSNQVAKALMEKGVDIDSIVGIMVERSLNMIIGILGILKAGGAYLPIDPDYPGGRIDYMLKDSNVRILVSEGRDGIKVSKGIDVVKIDELSKQHPTHLTYLTHPTQLCYAIYTSGTTGKPKGTLIQHRNLVNYVNWFTGKAAITSKDRTVLTSSFSFDLGYTLIFSTLLNGCPFHILPVEIYRSPEDLIGYISTHGITYIKVTPSHFTAIIENPCFTPQSVRTLRLVILGGEEVKAGDVEKAHAIGPHIAFMDEYGPTETTIGCIATVVDFDNFDEYKKQPTIGNPINNMNAFIFNEKLSLLPPGIPGELCLAGIGASRGYVNRPELTAEKFLFFSYKSYRSYSTYSSKRIYKSGDLARWLPNGSIEFLGRIDQQVKIRGFRVELGEIETQLRHHNDIKDAVVTASESTRKSDEIARKEDKYLCAYIVSKDDKQLSIGEIKQYLSSRLPDYMIPSYTMQIDKVPLTPNGKVDNKKLPKPEVKVDKEYSPPRNLVEKKLVEIWQEVLGLDKEVSLGIDDNFFELGGHSLKVARLLGRIHKAFDIKLSFSNLFESPTIRGLSQHMRGTEGRLHHDIQLAEEKEYYPLVPTQKRFYVFQQLNPADTSYNMTETMLFEGELSRERLEATFLQLLCQHETLRTSFHLLAGESIQKFHRKVKFNIEYYDLAKVNGAGHNKIISDFVRPFDLTHPPLWRVGLIKIASDKHFLIFDMHHLVADGTSIGIFIRDFNSIYNREFSSRLKIRFRDYIEWKTQRLKEWQGKPQKIFALEKLESELLNLPSDYPRPAAENYVGCTIRFEIDAKETQALYDFCLRQDVTLFMALLAVFNVLLSKLSGQETIAVGSPIAGRVHVNLDHLIGLFLNILCLRNRPLDCQRFSSFLQEVKERFLFTFENQDYQYDELVELTDVARGSGRNPLFDVMLVLQNMEMPEINIPGLTIKREVGEYLTSKFDMTLYCEEKETLVFKLEYKTSLFKQETIQRFIRYFENIISQVLEDTHKPISSIELITEEEKRRILYYFNDTVSMHPTGKTIHQLFAEQAEKSCDRVAVMGQSLGARFSSSLLTDQCSLTYKELDEASDRLSHLLNQKGVNPDANPIVGIMVERSLELIIGIMGILKAGGAYLPINTKYPQERINYLLKDSNAILLLTSDELSDVGRGKKYFAPTTCNLHLSLAYVIYTSGSTGSPKGVMVEHSSVVNILSALQDKYPLRESDTYLFKTSYIFDVSVAELFGWFLGGGRLMVLEAGGEREPQKIIASVERQCITHINFVPSMFAVFVEQLSRKNAGRLSSLRYIFLAGEALSGPLVERFNQAGCHGIRVENLYGPTEGTIYASYYSLRNWDKQGSVPIGKPLSNVRLYILDTNRCLQPPGVPGELYITGLGIARGYLNTPELTAEKFVLAHSLWLTADRREKKVSSSGEFPMSYELLAMDYFYKTGDLVRWLGDGNIEFLGRLDHQVKIRGFRIELGEIENRLLKHENIREAVVVCRGEESEDKYLCAYVVPRHLESFQELEVQAYLSEGLPDYMVPSFFMPLEKMPLNPSGKVNRKALPQPEITADAGYALPENEIEVLLVQWWSEILGLDKGAIGVHDNFFRLGGHSLKAAGLVSRIQKVFSIEFSIAEVFKTPSIRGIADFIGRSRESLYSSIGPIEEREYYELSAAQERLFVLQRMAPDKLTYNISGIMELAGKLDVHHFNECVKKLIKRHESLRTSFKIIDGLPVQRVYQEVEFEVEYFDLSTEDIEFKEEKEEIQNSFIRAFDISLVPLLRVVLIKLGEEKHILMVDMHHIISDGVSLNIFIDEFGVLYTGKQKPELRVQYKDFALWQKRLFTSPAVEKQRAYWQRQFEGEVPVLNLPYDFPRPLVQEFAGARREFDTEKEQTGKLKKLALEKGATPFIVLLAIFNLFISKLSNQVDIVVGVPTAGRSHPDIEGIFGMFVNTLPFRTQVPQHQQFNEFLDDVGKGILAATKNQDYPFEELAENISLERDLSRNPLYDVVFALQNTGLERVEIPGMKLIPGEYYSHTAKFDMTLQCIEIDDNLRFSLEYSTVLFNKATINRFTRYFRQLLSSVLENSEKPLRELEIIPEDEKSRLLADFNNTVAEYPQDKTIDALFEEQVEKSYDRAAVICEEQGGRGISPVKGESVSHLTYRELSRKSYQLAHLLRAKGVGPETIVGIMVERSIEMIICILGILKAGGAYLPIEPAYPQERIDFMLNDSKATLLLTSDELADAGKGKITGYCAPATSSQHLSLAYVIYTSGTTGRPRGTLVEHRALVNLCYWHNRYYGVTKKDHAAQYASMVFDASVWEIFPYLIEGASLHIIAESKKLDIDALNDYYERFNITISFLPTQVCEQFMEVDNKSLRVLLTGGDKLRTFIKKGYDLYNNYGPTENTVVTTAFMVDKPYHNIPIGSPIHNNSIFILNTYDLKLQPMGVLGELCVAGDALARGYLNSPELTAEKFLFFSYKPYRSYRTYFSNRIYKSGDLARWLPDGNIEFLGRKDLQVKVRGFRIEPGEIENCLLRHRGIKETVVSVREDDRKDRYLCAYIVTNAEISISNLRDYLAKNLPFHMVPSHFMVLDKMPLTPNGKIDRRALPEPEITSAKRYIAPRNKSEERLVEIWSDVLGIDKEKIGIDDNFFELGGHSLKAAALIGRIHKTFDIEISFYVLFQSPTIRSIHGYMETALKDIHQPMPLAEEKEYYPLAVSQKRFYVFQSLRPDDTSYNITETKLVEGELSGKKIEAVFRQMLSRHECLRTSFHMLKGEPVQRFHQEVEFAVNFYNLEKGNDADHKKIIKDFGRAFDLTCPPLFRVASIKIAPNKHFLTFDIHHLIADGTSMGIFTRDFQLFYNREPLPPLKIRFRDFVEWQQQKRESNRLKSLETPGMEEPVNELLNLPGDFPRPAVQTFKGSMIKYETGEQETAALYDFCLRRDATLYMVLMAAFNILLSKLCGQKNIVVGSPIAGRVHIDLDNLMGLFLHTICLRNSVADKDRFSSFLKKVKQRALHAYESQDYQYDQLVEQTRLALNAGRNPLFDVMLVLQNMENVEIKVEGFKITQETGEHSTSKFDITVICGEKDPLVFYWEYSTALFKQETILRYIRYFRNILSQIQENPHQTISEIEIITEDEKQQLLYDFNDSSLSYPAEKPVYRLVEEQAEKTPENPAVIFSRQDIGDIISMTYRELNQTSNRLARLLRKKGAGPGTIIGLMVERSLEMVTALQAILKAGGTYLPIDSQYPDNRIARMLESSRASMLLIGSGIPRKKSLPILSGIGDIEVLPMDELARELAAQSPEKLAPLSGPNHLIYIIFTSGSTGMPKGAGVYHRGFINLMHWFVTEFGLNEEDCNLLLTSLSFDLTQKNLYASLMKGGSICIPSLNYFEPRALLREIRDHRVTWINCTPSMFQKMVEHEETGEEKRLTSLRYVFLGGEPIFMPGLIHWLESPGCRTEIVNTYGPTECTDICNYYRIKEPRRFLNKAVPIGKPVYNVNLYIPDRNLHLQPVGIPGELLIGGAGVGIGYINDRDLTARKFIKHSFKPGEPEQLLYRTGDLVKWLADGNIEFLGRIDHQVKVRGFRIELGEIEKRLSSHAAVKEALVMAREQESMEKHLCAYIVPSTAGSLEVNELRDYLVAELPDYMVPPYFVVLEKMPLNPNGKIDRKALPEPDVTSGKNYIPPRNETEDILAGIWAEVLGIEKKQAGIYDNFFQLGGHSLKAAALIGKIHKTFCVEIPIAELFKQPTIESISRYLEQSKESLYLSIVPVEKREYYPLSSAQKRLFIIEQMDPGNVTYNIPEIFNLEGKLDRSRFAGSFKKLVTHHESLRTSFQLIAGEPEQRVHDEVEFEIEYFDLVKENQEKIQHSTFNIQHSFTRPFDLSRAPLLRVKLMEQEKQKHLLMVDMHHIISDGISGEVLIRDFISLYSGEKLPEPRLQYKDYAQWQNQEQESIRVRDQARYWQKEFAGEIPVLDLPTDYTRPPVQRFEGSRRDFEISRETSTALNALALGQGITLYMALLAIYTVFLSRLSNQEDIIIGAPVAGRRHTDLEEIIGMFVNTLALRLYPTGAKNFTAFLGEVKEKTLQAFENNEYQYEDLVEQVVTNRDMSRNPLFDVSFLLQNMTMSQLAIPGVTFIPYKYETVTTKFDLTLIGMEIEEKLLLSFEYSTNLFKKTTVERFVSYFKKIASAAAANPGLKICDVEILSKGEKREILYDFNSTTTDYPKEKALHELFMEQAARTPDNIALTGIAANLEWAGHAPFKASVTYGELNRKSNALAHRLRQKMVQPGKIVGIMVERSLEMMIGILGIIKAGGAYLPLAPDYPGERLAYIVKDSGASLLLAGRDTKSLIGIGCEIIEIDDSDLYRGENRNLESIAKPDDLVYVIYTSGSTGSPKGVMIEHRSMVNFIKGITDIIEFEESDRILSLTTISFDIFGLETLLPLTTGLQVVIGSSEEQLNPEAAARSMYEKNVSILQVTPSRLSMLLSNEESVGALKILKYLLVGGEAFPGPLLEKTREIRAGKIYNLYGPTETTIWSTVKEVSIGKCLNIGRPISNTRIYILGKGGILQPIGVPGELCIAGAGLARGYINNKELTGNKFTAAPVKKDERMYRTGDIARWLPDGNIDCLGRVDHQVKVRGYRIELSEIEKQLQAHPWVKEVVVVVKGHEFDDKYIAAYIVPVPGSSGTDDNEVLQAELKESLVKTLPGYMLPSYFIFLEKIPLTPNGKIDIRSLPAPEVRKGEEYLAPRDRIEKKLVAIWSEVLGIEYDLIGIDSNFFALGGQSLKAIIMIMKMHKAFNVKATLVDFFKTPTIRGLWQYMRQSKEDRYTAIEPVEKKEYYPLSSAQKRLYILQQVELTSTAYNIPEIIPFTEEPDIEKLEETFNKLINRHESLRTSFHMVKDETVQRICRDIEFKIEYHEAYPEDIDIANLQSAIVGMEGLVEMGAPAVCHPLPGLIERFIGPFDLSQAPLLRVRLIHISLNRQHHGHSLDAVPTSPSNTNISKEESSKGKSVLVVDLHHIISDGISTTLLIKEFMEIYGNWELPPLRIQYKDFAQWQIKQKGNTAIKKQQKYWMEEFSRGVSRLNLPTDFARPDGYNFEGDTVAITLGKEEVFGLKALGIRENATLYMVLFAILNVLMAKLSGNEDIVLGCPTAGRWHPDLHQLIGMFVNTLAIRCYPGHQKSFREFLKEVRDKVLDAFENQEYQFEDLVNNLELEIEVGRHPLFDVLLALQNYNEDGSENPVGNTPDLELNEFRYEYRRAKFDIMIVCYEIGGQLSFIFSYRTKLYKKETIERFTGYFREIVSAIIENPDNKIANIEIVSKDKQDKLIEKLQEEKREFYENIENNQEQPKSLEADFEY